MTPPPSMPLALAPPCQVFAELRAEQAKLEEQMAALLILPSPTEAVCHTEDSNPTDYSSNPTDYSSNPTDYSSNPAD